MARSDEEKRIVGILRESERLFHHEIRVQREKIITLVEEVEQFLESHNNTATLILARLACLAGDEGSMRKYHSGTIEAFPDDPSGYREYSESLRKLGCYSEAREMARQAHELAPDNGDLLYMLVKNCIVSGFFQASWRFLERAIKANARILTKEFHFLSEAVRFFSTNAVSDFDLERLQHIAMAVLRMEEIFPVGVLRSPAVHMEFMHGQSTNPATNAIQFHYFMMWGIQVPVKGDNLGQLNARLYQAILRSQLDRKIHSHVKIRFFHRTREGMMSSGFNY